MPGPLMHHRRLPRGMRAAFIILIAAGAAAGTLYDTGIVGVTRKSNHVFAEPGCFCHGDVPSPAVHVWMEGPETLQAGEVATYAVHVAKDSSIAAGFNVAAVHGSLGIVESAFTQLMQPAPEDSAELTHLAPRPAGGHDTVSWFFSYTAPAAPGTVDTLFANGNSVNLSEDPEGDAWAFAPEFLVHVQPATGVGEAPVASAFRLFQNYPNPFNPSTAIRFALARPAEIELSIFDVQGREVALLARGLHDAGDHEVTWRPASAVAATGIYFCRLRVLSGGSWRDAPRVQKMVVLK
jgi:hypothetical protein